MAPAPRKPTPKAKIKLPPPKPTYSKPPRQTIAPPKPKQTQPSLASKVASRPPPANLADAFSARYSAALKSTTPSSPTPGIKATTPTMTSTGVTRVSVPRGTSNPTPGAITSPPVTRGGSTPAPRGGGTAPSSDYSQIPFTPTDHSGSFSDMFNEQIQGAYGAIDSAEQSWQGATKGINQSLMSPELVAALGPKVYGAMVADILKKQASDASYYAQQRADLAGKIPTLYNTLQSQLADQDAKDAQIAHDYWNDSLKHGEFQQQFGLDTAKFGLDTQKFGWGQKVDQAKISLSAKKAAQDFLLGKGKLGLQGAKLGLDTWKAKNAATLAAARLGETTTYHQGTLTQRTIANQIAATRTNAKIIQDANNGKLNWAKLTLAQQKAIVDSRAKDNSYRAAMARVGVSNRSEQLRQAELDFKIKNGGVSSSTLATWKKEAGEAAGAAWRGVPNPDYGAKYTSGALAGQLKPTAGQQWASAPKLNYQHALNQIMDEGVPLSIAQQYLNRYYPKGKYGRPMLSYQERAAIAKKNKARSKTTQHG